MGNMRYGFVRGAMLLVFVMLLEGVEARGVAMLLDPGPVSDGGAAAQAVAVRLPDARWDLARLDPGPTFAARGTVLSLRGPAVPDPRSALLRLEPGEVASGGAPAMPDVRYALVRVEPAAPGSLAATGFLPLDAGPIRLSPFAAAEDAGSVEASLRLDLRCLRLAVADAAEGSAALTAASGWARSCFERLV